MYGAEHRSVTRRVSDNGDLLFKIGSVNLSENALAEFCGNGFHFASDCGIIVGQIRMVSARVNGKHEVLSLSINPEAVDPDDVEMLQDMVVAAVNEAMRKADAETAQNMSRLTGGLNLGGLF